MARCASDTCSRWRPGFLVDAGAGVWFDDVWYCSTRCLESAARERLEAASTTDARPPVPSPRVRLGALLLHQQAITPDRLRKGLEAQRRTGLRLGAQLEGLGLVSSLEVLKALAAQAGVAYLTNPEPSKVAQAPGGLAPATVKLLGAVPFEERPNEKRLKVACVAPLPRIAIAALREVSGWTVEPFLVTDQAWVTLLTAYGAQCDPLRQTTAARVDDIHGAAAHIAAAARRGLASTMHHARVAPFVWVRLEGSRQREDLLMRVGSAAAGGRPCQAAHM